MSTRQKLIELGVIKPATEPAKFYERPVMCKAALERTKAHLIKHGLLKPAPQKTVILGLH